SGDHRCQPCDTAGTQRDQAGPQGDRNERGTAEQDGEHDVRSLAQCFFLSWVSFFFRRTSSSSTRAPKRATAISPKSLSRRSINSSESAAISSSRVFAGR